MDFEHCSMSAAVLALPVWTAAQGTPSNDEKPKHRKYRLVDLGTLGGPESYEIDFARLVNSRGMALGTADTPTPDPFPGACFNTDCFVSHAVKWERVN
jgi:hypothetical protein